eukprot:TRINITY_DN27642_c0_g1_i2.p1 TRINITY_DN27642_c0_g1~~TRINITY_DN27642_c0_g1_i2.p1  ORF type:complete len:173 (+),score=38.25 TRINITY_DN27642_c0_g1_i2:136-654(+)
MVTFQRTAAARFACLVVVVAVAYLLYYEDEFVCPSRAPAVPAADGIDFGPEPTADAADRLAVMVPYITSQVPQILANFERWASPSHMPCTQPELADIVFLFNNEETAGQFAEILDALDAQPDVRRCFRDVHFAYASLTGADDKYPKGPDNQFFKFLFHEVSWSTTLGRNGKR